MAKRKNALPSSQKRQDPREQKSPSRSNEKKQAKEEKREEKPNTLTRNAEKLRSQPHKIMGKERRWPGGSSGLGSVNKKKRDKK